MSSTQQLLDDVIVGEQFEIHHCDGALRSLELALEHVQKGKRKSWLRGIKMQFERLANGDRLSDQHFPKEGRLPRRVGQQTDKHFRAIKRVPVRGYVWKSERFPNRYYVSHYVYKDYNRLKPKDSELVAKNWRLIEAGEHK